MYWPLLVAHCLLCSGLSSVCRGSDCVCHGIGMVLLCLQRLVALPSLRASFRGTANRRVRRYSPLLTATHRSAALPGPYPSWLSLCASRAINRQSIGNLAYYMSYLKHIVRKV